MWEVDIEAYLKNIIISFVVLDNSISIPSLTPKNLEAYKRGMVLKKAMALTAFQPVPTKEEDHFAQSSLPQTIEEEDLEQLPSGNVVEIMAEYMLKFQIFILTLLDTSSNHMDSASNYMETHAEVLPIRHSTESVRSR